MSRCLALFLVIISTAATAYAVPVRKPKLLVVIAVDQLRNDYLTRFEKFFLPAMKDSRPGGFKYFMDRGAYFIDAKLHNALTTTAVGHATMLTGAYPYLHGIVTHYWWDGELGKVVYCVEDAKAKIVTSDGKNSEGSGRSARSLLVTTIGDELKNAFGGKPILASVALKDRSAILMGGHRPDLTLWFDEKSASWVSSTYYVERLPGWVSDWNKVEYIKHVPKQWTKLLPEADYAYSTVMPAEAIASARGLGKSFPHPIQDIIGLITSPWGNAYTFDTAMEIVKKLKLGQHDLPDLLTVSLSTFDALGHNFGPLSAEMQDTTIRLDRMLSDFLAKLDRHVPGGLSRITLVLTSDHGAPINPALAAALRLPGGSYWPKDLANKANVFLRNKFGLKPSSAVVTSAWSQSLSFDQNAVAASGKEEKELARELASWLRTLPFIAAAYSRDDLIEGRISNSPMARKMALSVNPMRSGAVLFSPRPGFVELPDNTTEGLSHGAIAVQEENIPLAFVGPAFKPGRYSEEVLLNDLAPTLSAALGIAPPSGSEGKPLTQALLR